MSGRRVPSIYTNSIYARPSTDTISRNTPEQRNTHLQNPSQSGHRSRTESATSIYSRASNYSQHTGSPSVNQTSATPQSPTQAAPPPPISTASAPDTLLLAISGVPNANLKSYVQTALGRATSIFEIAILGSQTEEQALKQLKVDMYALAGSMNKSLGVQLSLMSGWSAEDMHRAIGELLGLGKKANGVGAMAERWGGIGGGDKSRALKGVILDTPLPQDGTAEAEWSAVDLLDLDTAELEESWKRSVGFLHTFARATVPHLRLAAHHEPAKAANPEIVLQGPFFITTIKSEPSNIASVNEIALRALLDSLSRTTGNRGITFGHVDHLLVPDPVPVQEADRPAVAPTNGWNDVSTAESPGGESPTKLWGMWSMQNELSSFD